MDVIEEGAKLGMPPTIATNATNVAKNAERMVAAPMALIQLLKWERGKGAGDEGVGCESVMAWKLGLVGEN